MWYYRNTCLCLYSLIRVSSRVSIVLFRVYKNVLVKAPVTAPPLAPLLPGGVSVKSSILFSAPRVLLRCRAVPRSLSNHVPPFLSPYLAAVRVPDQSAASQFARLSPCVEIYHAPRCRGHTRRLLSPLSQSANRTPPPPFLPQLVPDGGISRIDVDAETATWKPDDLVSVWLVTVILFLSALLLLVVRSRFFQWITDCSAAIWWRLKAVRLCTTFAVSHAARVCTAL